MTLQDAISRLEGAENTLQEELRVKSLELATAMRDKIKRRVQGRGVSAKEIPFSPYKNRWREERVRRGKQVGHKDYTFTGYFMTDFTPRPQRTEGNILITDVGMASEKNQKIESGHSAYEGVPILDPSPAEVAEIERRMRGFIEIKMEEIFQ